MSNVVYAPTAASPRVHIVAHRRAVIVLLHELHHHTAPLTDHGRMVELPLYSAVNVELVRNVLKNDIFSLPARSDRALFSTLDPMISSLR
jgi:hypothetical protein